MKSSILYASLLSLCGPLAAAIPRAVPRPRQAECPEQNATEFALIYGEPLVAYEVAFQRRPASQDPNFLASATVLATPQQTQIVSPNVDTLYMGQSFDLSAQDLEITIPEVEEDRYYSVSFYTPTGDNFINLGALVNTTAGTYLLTPATSSEQAAQIVEAADDSSYAGTIYAVTSLGTLLIRILVRNPDDDLAKVVELQKGFGTATIARDGPTIGPSLNADLFLNDSSTRAEHVLDLVSRFESTIPYASDGGTIPNSTIDTLQTAGLDGEEDYVKPDCVNLTAAAGIAVATLQSYRALYANQDLGNGWFTPPPNRIGQYGGDYTARALVARWAYLALTSDWAVYPTFPLGFSLMSNESYMLNFTGRPPTTGVGFWSVTMYGSDGYLVENPINRYALGDRSELTFADGSPVYGDDSGDDGEFTILIQADQPPEEWMSNWLPSPSEPGPMQLLLRFYAPEQALIDGTYVYPAVTKGAAITDPATSAAEHLCPDPHAWEAFLMTVALVAAILL